MLVDLRALALVAETVGAMGDRTKSSSSSRSISPAYHHCCKYIKYHSLSQ